MESMPGRREIAVKCSRGRRWKEPELVDDERERARSIGTLRSCGPVCLHPRFFSCDLFGHYREGAQKPQLAFRSANVGVRISEVNTDQKVAEYGWMPCKFPQIYIHDSVEERDNVLGDGIAPGSGAR